MHIRVSAHITPDSPLPPPDFEALTPELAALSENEPSLTSSEYKPGAWVPLVRARQEFGLGGPEAFDKWVVGAMMIDPGEAYVEYNTSAKVGYTVSIPKTIPTIKRLDLEEVPINLFCR